MPYQPITTTPAPAKSGPGYTPIVPAAATPSYNPVSAPLDLGTPSPFSPMKTSTQAVADKNTIDPLKEAFSPYSKTSAPNIIGSTEEERKSMGDLYGPRIITEPAKFIYNTVSALVNAVPQLGVDLYSAGKTFAGKSGDVTLPFNPERIGFDKSDVKGNTIKSVTNSTLDRMQELDAASPNTPHLNAVKAFGEKVFNRAILNPIIGGDVIKSASKAMLEWSKSSPQLGLSAQEIKDLEPADALREVTTRFHDRAQQIFSSNLLEDGTLSPAGREQIDALSRETKSLGQAFHNGEIPELNPIGKFFDQAALRLNQDVGNLGRSTALTVPKDLAAEESLPGYRKTPGQAPAFGLSTEERQPVGFGDRSKMPNGRFPDDYKPQGMTSSVKDIKDQVNSHINNLKSNYELDGLDFKIKDIEITGSRSKGVGKKTSDLDVLLEYTGNAREDDLFNALNREHLKIDGVKVDINPITEDRSGTIDEYLKFNEQKKGKYVGNEPIKGLSNASTNSVVPTEVSRFKTEQDLIDYVSKNGAGFGAALKPVEMKQLIDHLVSQGEDNKTIQTWGGKTERGIVYKSYGGGVDVVLGKVKDPRFGSDSMIVAQINKQGMLDGKFRIHGTPIEKKDIITKLGDDGLLQLSNGQAESPSKGPVTAYSKGSSLKGVGSLVSTEEARQIVFQGIPEKDVRLIFTDELIDGTAIGKYQPTKEIDGIKSVLKPMIKLFTEGGKTSAVAAYHESFHYIFGNYFTEEQRAAAIKLAQDEIGLLKKTDLFLRGYSPERHAEEYLAENYAREKAEGAGYTGPTKNFFERLDEILKKIVGYIRKVYDKLYKSVPNKQGGFADLAHDFGAEENPLNKKIEEYKEMENGGSILDPEAKTQVGDFSITNKALKHFVEQRTLQGANIKKAAGFLYDTLTAPDVVAPNTRTPGTEVYIKRIPDDPKKALAVIVDANKEIVTIHYKRFNQFENLKNNLMAAGGTPSPVTENPSSFSPEGDLAARRISTLQQPSDDSSPGSVSSPSGEVKQALASPMKTLHPNPQERKLEDLLMQRDMQQEALDANPAKQLSKYANQNGELPEVVGTGGMFKKGGDDIVTQLGFADSESAREAYQNYLLQKKRIVDLNERIVDAREAVRISKSEDRDVKSLSTILERAAKKTDKQISDMQKALEHPETDAEIKARKAAATERMIAILEKTYGKVPAIVRDTPEWLMQATEHAATLTPEELQKMSIGDPTKLVTFDATTPLKERINWLDYWRTPDRVLKKIGFGSVAKDLRRGYENYLAELPLHIDLISKWRAEVPSAESNVRIFKWLDGQRARKFFDKERKVFERLELSKKEMVVAKEIKTYLRQWADRLGLPIDNKITHYITHIFGLSGTERSFDEELAKIIANRIPGSVYDPFLEKRLGRKGYLEDTWRALEAYSKRAVRKANMDPVLENLKARTTTAQGHPSIEVSQYNYLKRYADRVNMRPTEFDILMDNSIKQIIGFKLGDRPTALITSTMRRWVYRELLGLNFNNAVKNLTQGVNTFAKLGTKYTTIGYTKLITNPNIEELKESLVLSQDFVQDKSISALHNLTQKMDKGLFALHNLTEYINRGSAYWGAKAQAIDNGATEQEAKQYAKKLVRDTQFNYGVIDTPVMLSSDLMKTLFQMMSYPIKQAEFVAEMVIKDKNWAGLMRYILGSLIMVYTVGQVFNIKGKDYIPLASMRFGTPPTLALPGIIWNAATDASKLSPVKGPRGGQSPLEKTGISILKNLPLPASLQIQKTASFIKSMTTPKKSTAKKALLF